MSTDSQPAWAPKHRHTTRWILIFIGAVIVAFCVVNYWPVEGQITIGHDTTRITGPRNADGTVNYVAYLRDKYSKGVTPGNNALVVLLQIEDLAGVVSAGRGREFLDALGLAAMPPRRGTFTDIDYHDCAAIFKADGGASGTGVDDLEEYVETFSRRPWSAQRYPTIAKWLDDNADVLAVVIEASTRSRYYYPVLADGKPPRMVSMSWPPLHGTAGLARALATRAMQATHDGRIRDAHRDIGACHRLARLMGQGYSLTDQLFACAIAGVASDASAVLAAGGKLSGPQARSLLADLKAMGPPTDIATSIDESQRFAALDTIAVLSRPGGYGHIPRGLGFRAPVGVGQMHWNHLLKLQNERYDRVVAKMRGAPVASVAGGTGRCCVGMSTGRVVKMSVARLGGRLTRAIYTEYVDDYVTEVFLPRLASPTDTEGAAQARLDLARVATALAVHRAEKGDYPDRLEELEAIYGGPLPADPLGGKRLIYRREPKGYILYSLGENLVDDGGDDKYPHDDVIVRVPVIPTTAPATSP